MSERSFAFFVKDILIKKSKDYEKRLLDASYNDLASAKEAAGIRGTLVGLAESMDSLLENFLRQKD